MNDQAPQTISLQTAAIHKNSAAGIASELRSVAKRLAEIVTELHLHTLRPQIEACTSLISTEDKIDVAVFGRFKAGKSSFLNHLIARDVLPIGVVPLTSVITRLRYGPTDKVVIRFINGNSQIVPLSQLASFVTESQNPNNEKQVEAVEIELPELREFMPLEFVDTPGVGSAFAHNTQATLSWLPHVGAAIVAISSEAPLSERDLDLLRELHKYTPKIVILLTKADLLTEDQRAEVLEFVKRQLTKTLGTQLPIFFYSIKRDFSELKTALINQLLFPLIQNRSETALEILRHKLATITNQAINYVKIALASANQSESARATLKEKLADEHRQFDLLREELSVLAQEWDAKAFEWTLEQLRPHARALEEKLIHNLEIQLQNWKLPLPKLLDTYYAWMEQSLRQELQDLSTSQRHTFIAPLQNVQTHLKRVIRALQDRLATHVKNALGIELAPREIQFRVIEPTAPPVAVGVAFDVTLDLIGYLVPMSIFRRCIHRRLLHQARFEVRKNISRLTAAWRNGVGKAIQELKQQAINLAENELATLEQMALQQTSAVPSLETKLADLNSLLNKLNNLQLN